MNTESISFKKFIAFFHNENRIINLWMSPNRAKLVGAKNGHDEVFNFSPWRPPSLFYYILYYWSVRLAIGNSPAKLIYCPVLIPFKVPISGWAFRCWSVLTNWILTILYNNVFAICIYKLHLVIFLPTFVNFLKILLLFMVR